MTLGTIFIERILDLFAIAIMGLAAGFWSFRTGFPPEIQFVAVLGIAVIVALAGLLFLIRNFGRAILGKLPLPARATRALRPVRGRPVLGQPPVHSCR